MKVIDLLNNLSSGITYTKKARIRYFDRKNDYKDECILNEVAIGFRLYNQNIKLNDEVEIIEEPQEHKIPEKLIHCYTDKLTKEFVIKCFDDVSDKINEILDYLEENNEKTNK